MPAWLLPWLVPVVLVVMLVSYVSLGGIAVAVIFVGIVAAVTARRARYVKNHPPDELVNKPFWKP
jgi:hypothetical protein